MKYAVELGSGAVTYIPNFIQICLVIRKLIGKMHRYVDSMESVLAFKIRKIG
jgi:hypothetical protein